MSSIPKVSIDTTVSQSYHDNTGQKRIDNEIKEVTADLNAVITQALKKHKSANSTKTFLELLEKSLSQDAAGSYVATRLLITKRLVQNMMPDMLESLTLAASKFTKARIEAEANKIFERETHMIIVKLLGMEEDKWDKGNLRVDNCNGRKSAITEYINENASGILGRVMKDAFDEFDKSEKVKLKKQVSAAVMKQIKDQVEQSVWRSTQGYASKKADELTKELVETALENNDVFKSLRLIEPDDE